MKTKFTLLLAALVALSTMVPVAAEAGRRDRGGHGFKKGGHHGRHFGNHRHRHHRHHHRHHHRGGTRFYVGLGFPSYGYGYYPYNHYPYAYSTSYYRPVYQGGYVGRGGVVAQVQIRLARAGYYHGAIDGIIGPATRRAIYRWEQRHGLYADGRIDGRLLARMGLS